MYLLAPCSQPSSRMELNELQAKLDARKSELLKLQRKISKAEKVKRDDSTPRPSLQAAGTLVRQSDDPHSPIWLEDQYYPAQYLVRHTRSMTTKCSTTPPNLVVSIAIEHYNAMKRQPILIPRLVTPIPESDFDLPDAVFEQIKLQKLEADKRSTTDCETNVIWLTPNETVLKRAFCLHNKLSNEEPKLLLASKNIVAVVFLSQYSVWNVFPEQCWSYPICGDECVLCGEVFENDESECSVLAVGGCLRGCTVRVHMFKKLCKFFTVDLVTSSVFSALKSCGLCVWETTGYWWVSSYNDDNSVFIWTIDKTHGSAECVCSFELPQLTALKHINNGGDHQLIASTQHSLITFDCRTGTLLQDVCLACPGCSGLDAVPILVAAKLHMGTLFVIMSYKSHTTLTSEAVAWLLAISEGKDTCKLLQTYSHSQSQSNSPQYPCRCNHHFNSISTLLGCTRIAIWSIRDSQPTQTLLFKGNTTVLDYQWLESNTLVTLDFNGHVHGYR